MDSLCAQDKPEHNSTIIHNDNEHLYYYYELPPRIAVYIIKLLEYARVLSSGLGRLFFIHNFFFFFLLICA